MLAQVMRLDTLEAGQAFDGSAQTKTFKYNWKRAVRLRSLFFVPRPNGVAFADLSALMAQASFRIEDSNQWYFASTGRGPSFTESLALHGKGRRWFPLDRVVKSGDIWTIAVKSTAGNAFQPIFFMEIDDP